MELVPGMPWDCEWEPLDEYGHPFALRLAEPFGFRAGGVCVSCGSTDIRGLRIYLRTQNDFFDPEAEDLDRDQAMIVMACADWHDFFVISDRPDDVQRYMMNLRRVNGESGYTDGDIRDGLSDRWGRIMDSIKSLPAVQIAFHEARRKDLERHMKWPPENVTILVPLEKGGTEVIPGYQEWTRQS